MLKMIIVYKKRKPYFSISTLIWLSKSRKLFLTLNCFIASHVFSIAELSGLLTSQGNFLL